MAVRLALLTALCLAVAGCERSSETAESDETAEVNCMLSIRPPDATVVVSRNGAIVVREKVGDETLQVTLQSGTYTIEAMKDGYQPFVQRATFGKGKTTFAARLTPILGELVVRSDPGVAVEVVGAEGATVPLGTTGSDGVLRITTLDEGRYSIRLTRPGCEPVTRTVDLNLGRTVELQAKPAPAGDDGE